jgi:hypothetical protein
VATAERGQVHLSREQRSQGLVVAVAVLAMPQELLVEPELLAVVMVAAVAVVQEQAQQ